MGDFRDEDRAGRADWMAMRNRAAIDVKPRIVYFQFRLHSQRNGGESLIHFETINLADCPSRAIKCLSVQFRP